MQFCPEYAVFRSLSGKTKHSDKWVVRCICPSEKALRSCLSPGLFRTAMYEHP